MSTMPGNNKLTTMLIIVGSLIVVLLLVIIIFISPLSKFIFPEEKAPTLALVVTEPPTLDATTGKYLVVVEALVTGNPEPEVLFNRNDGLGTVERHQALLLLDEDESFMLTAIAANKIGEAKAALEINNSIAAGHRTEVFTAEGSNTYNSAEEKLVAVENEGYNQELEGDNESLISSSGGNEDSDSVTPSQEDSQADQPSTVENRPPVITFITIEAKQPVTNKTYTVSAIANDPDNDNLTFKWKVSGGTIVTPSQNSARWLTPANPGRYTITVKASDGRGGVDEESWTLQIVRPSQTSSQVSESEAGNIPPPISTSAVPGESGSIITAMGKAPTIISHSIMIGDSGPDNGIIKGFISFDISKMHYKKLKTVELRLSNPSVTNDPSFLHSSDAWVTITTPNVPWGPRALSAEVERSSFRFIKDFKTYDIVHTSMAQQSSSKLIDELQTAVTREDLRFQLRLAFYFADGDNDGEWDFVKYNFNNITLNVTFDEPTRGDGIVDGDGDGDGDEVYWYNTETGESGSGDWPG
jgi:hypothetical protein